MRIVERSCAERRRLPFLSAALRFRCCSLLERITEPWAGRPGRNFANTLYLMLRSSVQSVLWPAYLFFLAWILTPVYFQVLAVVLPISETDVDRILLIATIFAGPLAFWSGVRGGPLLLSEPTVIFDLVLERGRAPLGAAIMRQALLASGIGGIAGVCLASMSLDDDYVLAIMVSATVRGLGVGMMVMALAVLWSTSGERSLTDRLLAVACSAVPVVAMALAPPGSAFVALSALTAGAVAVGLAVWRSTSIPVPVLWARSRGLTDLRASTGVLDVRSVLSELRFFRDGPRVDRSILASGPRRPLSVWRSVRSLSSAPTVGLIRIVIIAPVIALAFAAVPGTNAQLMLGTGLLFVAGIDLATPLASLAAQPKLSNIGSIGWVVLLSGHLAVMIIAVGALALIAWTLADAWHTAPPFRPWLGLAGGVTVATSLQARNGPPNIAKILDMFGFPGLGGALAVRGLIPFAVALAAVVGMSRVADNEVALADGVWIAVMGIAAVSVLEPLKARQ